MTEGFPEPSVGVARVLLRLQDELTFAASVWQRHSLVIDGEVWDVGGSSQYLIDIPFRREDGYGQPWMRADFSVSVRLTDDGS